MSILYRSAESATSGLHQSLGGVLQETRFVGLKSQLIVHQLVSGSSPSFSIQLLTTILAYFQQSVGNIPQILVHIDMRAWRSCCRFVSCRPIMRFSRATTSQRCSIEMWSGDWRPLRCSEPIVMTLWDDILVTLWILLLEVAIMKIVKASRLDVLCTQGGCSAFLGYCWVSVALPHLEPTCPFSNLLHQAFSSIQLLLTEYFLFFWTICYKLERWLCLELPLVSDILRPAILTPTTM